MSRKQFIESHGATCNNWRNSWAFVNHAERFVIFGAWDTKTTSESAMIFTTDWERNSDGKKSPAYGEALELIELVEKADYSLKTFPIIRDKDFDLVSETGSAQIKRHVEELTDANLEKKGNEYFAIARFDAKYAMKEDNSVSDDIAAIFTTTDIETERETLVKARVGQGNFRKNVTQLWGNGDCCALTLINIRELLIASHIKPWSKCGNNEERLDGANGILLCSHIDKLFDSHLLTFENRGSRFIVKLSPKLDKGLMTQLGIESGQELCSNSLSPQSFTQIASYLLDHNTQFNIKALL